MAWSIIMAQYYVCPRCGTVDEFSSNTINSCIFCDYNETIIVTEDEYTKLYDYFKKASPSEQDDLLNTKVEATLRQKYTYKSPFFDKEYNEKRKKYESTKNKAVREHIRFNSGVTLNDIKQPQSLPHCPTCNSTNVKKISAGAKAVSVGLFGIFSQKVKRQFHCNNCGYEW